MLGGSSRWLMAGDLPTRGRVSDAVSHRARARCGDHLSVCMQLCLVLEPVCSLLGKRGRPAAEESRCAL